MTSAAVHAAAKLISKLLVEEVKFLYGVHDKVEELQVELSWMQVFLQDADKKKHQDEMIRMWVSQIQALAYEAEDIVEIYIHKVSLRGRDKFWRTLPKKLPCTLYNAIPLHVVGSGIDKLTLKITKLNKRLKSYGLQIGNVDPSVYITRIRDKRRTYSNTVDTDLIRREEDVNKLVNQLLDETEETSNVVAIVGMGGLGKTMLAREVCRDKAIVDRFTHLVWIYVSPQPQRRSILEETLRQLGLEGDSKSEEGLRENVREGLTRECLVVLDDLWNKDIMFLKKNFATSKAKILLTTRQDVAHRMDPKVFIRRPTLLNDDESWSLLRKKAGIKAEDIFSDDKLENMGKDMLKHCKGLPITIVALGGILATKQKTVPEWEGVLKNITSYLARYADRNDDDDDEEEEKGVGVLELSYYELPLYLKPCFLYLGNFPKKAEIPTNTLYQLWEAEGLIQVPAKRNEINGVDILDIAEQYLDDLVKRCMVEVSQLHENGAIKTCILHDVMRNLCLKKSEEEMFLEVVTTDDPRISSSYGSLEPSRQVWTTHRVAISARDKNSAETFFDSLQENRVQLRSLLIDLHQDNEQVTKQKFSMWFSKMAKAFELLRVLRVECVTIEKLPDEIGSCIHLRYLSFKLAHESKVPNVIWKLTYLQTLDLQHNDKCLTVPNKLWMLKRLSHLYLPVAYKAEEKLRFSQPRQVKTLVNIDLKDLDEEDMKNLTNLRMLSFKKIESTESLSFVFNSNIITSNLVENPLSTLFIDAETINRNPQMLSSSTDARFKVLTIKGVIKPSLKHIALPGSLFSLELRGSRVLGDRIMDVMIPKLKELHLKENAIRGRKLVVSSQKLPNLQKLTLELSGDSELLEVEGTLPKRCLFRIRCPTRLKAQVSFALQQLQHRRDLIRIDLMD